MTSDKLPPAVCMHCGVGTLFADDPSPDLCRRCQGEGKLSDLWTRDHQLKWEAGLERLADSRRVFRERYGLSK